MIERNPSDQHACIDERRRGECSGNSGSICRSAGRRAGMVEEGNGRSRELGVKERRGERLRTALAILVLILCWDAVARLDGGKLPAPREAADGSVQNALCPVSARPTVS